MTFEMFIEASETLKAKSSFAVPL